MGVVAWTTWVSVAECLFCLAAGPSGIALNLGYIWYEQNVMPEVKSGGTGELPGGRAAPGAGGQLGRLERGQHVAGHLGRRRPRNLRAGLLLLEERRDQGEGVQAWRLISVPVKNYMYSLLRRTNWRTIYEIHKLCFLYYLLLVLHSVVW